MKRNHLLLAALLLFAFFLRVYKVGEIPAGFYSDEALTGYEAYSILTTGRDQYGNIMPAAFKAFGDYRPGLFIYATVPFVLLFGLTEFATRLPSVIFSTATVLTVYGLGREIFKKQRAALFAAFIFTVSPWSIQFARMSHDTNLATFLITLALYIFLTRQKPRDLLFSLVLFSLSLYAYYTSRVFVPLFLAVLMLVERHSLWTWKKTVGAGLVVMLIIAMPFFYSLSNRETGWSRVETVSLWGDPGIAARTEEYRREDAMFNFRQSRIFHNKVIDGGKTFLSNFASHFEPSFLLFNGDPIKIYQSPGNGILLFVEPMLIIVALIHIVRRPFRYNSLLLAWFVIGLLPDSLTRLTPAAARIHLVLPLVSILGGLGLEVTIHRVLRFPGTVVKYGSLFYLGGFLVYNLQYYLHAHFIHAPLRYAREWHYGVNQLVKELSIRAPQYEKIWITKSGWGWINFVFYLKYPPVKFQQEAVLSPKNEFGLGWVYGFNKYYFDDLPPQIPDTGRILYAGAPDDFPKQATPLATIYYPDGSPAFYIIDREELRNTKGSVSKGDTAK